MGINEKTNLLVFVLLLGAGILFAREDKRRRHSVTITASVMTFSLSYMSLLLAMAMYYGWGGISNLRIVLLFLVGTFGGTITARKIAKR